MNKTYLLAIFVISIAFAIAFAILGWYTESTGIPEWITYVLFWVSIISASISGYYRANIIHAERTAKNDEILRLQKLAAANSIKPSVQNI